MVDLTLPLAAHFQPDENTVGMIKQIVAMPLAEPGEMGEKE